MRGGGSGCFGSLVFIFAYTYVAFCVYTIADKAGHDAPWLAFIPFALPFVLVSASGRSLFWILAFFIPGLNLFACIWVAIGLAE